MTYCQKPEDNILTHTAVSMQTKIKGGEINYYSNIIIIDSYSVSIGVENICTACISHTTEDFVRELADSMRRIKGFGVTRSPLTKKGTL